MNCLYESVAGIFLHVRGTFVPNIDVDELGDAEDNLENCRRNLMAREETVAREYNQLGKEALQKRRAGDIQVLAS